MVIQFHASFHKELRLRVLNYNGWSLNHPNNINKPRYCGKILDECAERKAGIHTREHFAVSSTQFHGECWFYDSLMSHTYFDRCTHTQSQQCIYESCWNFVASDQHTLSLFFSILSTFIQSFKEDWAESRPKDWAISLSWAKSECSSKHYIFKVNFAHLGSHCMVI